MQTHVKVQSRDFKVNQEQSTFTLKIDKRQLVSAIRKLITVLLFLTLAVLLTTTYNTQNPQFWSLLKVTLIISMVMFIAIKSNKTFKN